MARPGSSRPGESRRWSPPPPSTPAGWAASGSSTTTTRWCATTRSRDSGRPPGRGTTTTFRWRAVPPSRSPWPSTSLVHGRNPRGYRVFNLAAHLANALLLLWIVRRLLAAWPALGMSEREAAGLAGAVALLWSLHPLQTELVEYVSQRTELLVSFFYLLTLAAALARFGATSRRASAAWSGVAIGACALGAMSKEVIVTAPLAVLLCDRAFASGGFARALRRHRGLYAGLACSWVILIRAGGGRSPGGGGRPEQRDLASLVPADPGGRDRRVPAALLLAGRAATQLSALDRPQLGGFPAPGRPRGRALRGDAVGLLASPPARLRGGVVLPDPRAELERRARGDGDRGAAPRLPGARGGDRPGGGRGIRRPPRLGRRQTEAECARLEPPVSRCSPRPAWGSAGGPRVRLDDYRSRVSIWQQDVRVDPDHPAALFNLASALLDAGRPEPAAAYFDRGIRALERLDPETRSALLYSSSLDLVAAAYQATGRAAVGLPSLRRLAAMHPDVADVQLGYARLCLAAGRPEEALDPLQRAAALDPGSPEPWIRMAEAFERSGRTQPALSALECGDPARARRRARAAGRPPRPSRRARGRGRSLMRGRSGLLFACAVALLLLGGGCREAGPPNLVLISIDSLRADRLGCYGAERDTSPAMDRLAADGVRFETAVAPTSWTLPSHVTLLTGLSIPAHRVAAPGDASTRRARFSPSTWRGSATRRRASSPRPSWPAPMGSTAASRSTRTSRAARPLRTRRPCSGIASPTRTRRRPR